MDLLPYPMEFPLVIEKGLQLAEHLTYRQGTPGDSTGQGMKIGSLGGGVYISGIDILRMAQAHMGIHVIGGE
jgi:hypothetical protein